MTCDRNPRKYGDAAQRNGIGGQVNRYLNTVGSWSTYRDIGSAEEIPERIAQVTGAYFGIKGLIEGHPRLVGVLGAIIGVHALEKVTGGLATTGMRLYGRGKPVASYRGIMIRKSPFTDRSAGALNRLTGGRVLAASGYYFFEGGRTWHTQSTTVQLGDEARTLTRIKSFSLPQREYFFDRPVTVPGDREPAEGEKTIPIQRIIDTIKGDEEPDAIPGFIGGINELEGITPLRNIKHTLFAANWLLVDPGERDGSDGEYVDYEALVRGTRPGGATNAGGVYRVNRPATTASTGSSYWPSTSRIPIRTPSRPEPTVRPVSSPPPPPSPPPQAEPYGANLFRSGPTSSQDRRSTPAARYQDRIRIAERDYPLVVKRLVRSPVSGQVKADAVYYDDSLGQWRTVVETEDRLNLARAVQEGRLSVVGEKDWPKA
jgi:hypothetical protein